jgi:hypothetical protein
MIARSGRESMQTNVSMHADFRCPKVSVEAAFASTGASVKAFAARVLRRRKVAAEPPPQARWCGASRLLTVTDPAASGFGRYRVRSGGWDETQRIGIGGFVRTGR